MNIETQAKDMSKNENQKWNGEVRDPLCSMS